MKKTLFLLALLVFAGSLAAVAAFVIGLRLCVLCILCLVWSFPSALSTRMTENQKYRIGIAQ